MGCKYYTILFLLVFTSVQGLRAQEGINQNKFRQLGQALPTPNSYRSAAGAPGHEYWQQKADYNIRVHLDDAQQRIYGEEIITYHNQSPDGLSYLWLQLDQNRRSKNSDTYKISEERLSDRLSFDRAARMMDEFDGGFTIEYVRDGSGKDLNYTINKTMMRVDLPAVLSSGDSYSFAIKWWYNINDRSKIGGRSGYEYFPEEDNYLYTIAQFFPRMCVYSDVEGWQNKQFLGRGEFALPFGDYEVRITAPADHYVAATGILQNQEEVLSTKEIGRLRKAADSYEDPVFIVTEEEAIRNEQEKADGEKTWRFTAENVRDFAFASSRKFIWDAMAVPMENGRQVLAMSMYPKEGNPLWERYSTRVVAHTLKWFSHYTFDYPYPVAWSIHTDRIGMEYPMICFNGGRPEKDGTYSERTKYGMISVIIHEVGHNYFPMIVNSDERQWTWMDEGLNTFVQYLTEQQWEREYPSRRGPAHKIVDYMKGDKDRIMPIMTNSESIFQFGNNAYGKPATALNILRETIMGRELFDYAFKEYARRWMFKHPTPADFFRTMEDASGVDLDWFWRGWFYTNDHVDLAIGKVRWLKADPKDPASILVRRKEQLAKERSHISAIRNRESIEETVDEADPDMKDFYSHMDPVELAPWEEEEYKRYYSNLTDDEKAVLDSVTSLNFYELTFEMKGEIPMPVIFKFEYTDGTEEVFRIPAEVWRFDQQDITKVIPTVKEVEQIILDPFLETADIDTSNNYFPPKQEMSRFELFKRSTRESQNPMQKAQKYEKGIKP